MNELERRIREARAGLTPASSRIPARYERAARHGILAEQTQAFIEEAHVARVKRVAGSGLRAVEELTDTEALALTRNPLGEARYRAVVDTATAGIAHIVADTAER